MTAAENLQILMRLQSTKPMQEPRTAHTTKTDTAASLDSISANGRMCCRTLIGNLSTNRGGTFQILAWDDSDFA